MANISPAQRNPAILCLVGFGVAIVLEVIDAILLHNSIAVSVVAGVFVVVGIIGLVLIYRRR